MTNKLPKVGTRFLDKKTGEIVTLESTQTIKNHRWYHFETHCGLGIVASTYQFKNHYEEIPESNSNQVEDDCPNEQAALDWDMEDDRFTDVGKTIEEKGCTERENEYFKAGWIGARDMFRPSKEVEKAKRELQNAINCWDYCGKWPSHDSEEYYLFESARNLLNALDSQKEDKLRDKEVCQSNVESKKSLAGQNKQESHNTCRVERASKLKDKESEFNLEEYYNDIHCQNFSAEQANYIGTLLLAVKELEKRINKLGK